MTKPSGGYPDFQGYASWKGTALTAPHTFRAAGLFTIGTLNLSNYGSINVFVDATAGNGELQVNWWTDSTMTVLIDSYLIPVITAATINISMPAISQFVSVAINVLSGGGMTVSHMVTPSNSIPYTLIDPAVPVQTGNNLRALPASSTDTLLAEYVIPGEAYLSFTPADTTGKLSVAVQSLNKNGTVAFTVYNNTGPTVPVNAQILLPLAPVNLVISNSDAVNPHTYTACLVSVGH